MNSVEFEVRLNKIFESLFQSGFLQNVKGWNFSSAELAQIQVQLCQVATQTALNLQELDYKKQQIAMEQEKMRQELEMAISREKIQNIKLACEAIASAVQAESIKRSVVDNATINKTNAYVSYFNVAMNAVANNAKLACEAIASAVQAESIKRSVVDNATINKTNAYVSYFNVAMNAVANNAASLNSGSMLKNISDLVVTMIDKINDEPLSSNFDELLNSLVDKALNIKDLGLGNKQLKNISDLVVTMIDKINDEPLSSNFDELLNSLVDKALNIKDLGLGNKQVSILAPKTILAPNEPITLLGISVFTDNRSEFVYREQIIDSKFFVFQSDELGSHEIIFRVRDNSNEWIEDKIFIKVAKPKEIKGECDGY